MDIKKTLYILTHWEKWHYHVKYIPLYPAWLWYCLRSGSFWWFTPSNPTLTFGGFEGESKKEMYQQLPPSSYPRSIYISPISSFDEAEEVFLQSRFGYPFAAKPDIGLMGLLFRKIENRVQFKQYHMAVPGNYIIQDYVQYPIEVSVFYHRLPYLQQGGITGFIKKEMLQVKGDGKSTLWQLISIHPIAGLRADEMKRKHAGLLDTVLPPGELFILSLACNLSRGGKLISLAHRKTPALTKMFDELSHYAGHFYYGRYDIKCATIKDLEEGKKFLILEYNGCGAEPHHIYGNRYTLFEAYKIILQHWKILYKISRYNHKTGVPYWPFKKGYTFLWKAKKHYEALKRIDSALTL